MKKGVCESRPRVVQFHTVSDGKRVKPQCGKLNIQDVREGRSDKREENLPGATGTGLMAT